MLTRIALYAYGVALIAVSIAGIWMECEPEFDAPPKLYWARAVWWTFFVLYWGQFFIRPRVKPSGLNRNAPPETN
jgi:hypothetical protein